MTPDREDLRAAQRARGACLIWWPAMVATYGHAGAAARLNAWEWRMQAIQEAMNNPQPERMPDGRHA